MNKNRRILLVDDDEVLLSCLKRMLERQFDVDIAAGPDQALESVTARGPYAVVVSDMHMPRMPGTELLSRIKQVCPDTVGLLLSGNANADEAATEIRNGTVFRLVEKPCPHDELVEILKEALAHYESSSPSDPALPAVSLPTRTA